jgi:hypothetical protein
MFKRFISKLHIPEHSGGWRRTDVLRLTFIPCQENDYRPKFLESNVLLYYIVVLLILKLIVVLFLVGLPRTIFFTDISRTVLIELTNKERQSLGLNSLEENVLLNKAARLKAQDIITYDYFSHQSPTGITPWYWFKKAGYSYQAAGENLGIGFLDSEEIYQAWDNSPSHRANLLNPKYQDIGIAVLKGDFEGNETTLVVQLFGSQQTKEIKEIIPELSEKEIEKQKEEVKEKPEETKPEETKLVETPLEKQVLGETYIEPFTAEERDGFKFKFLKFMALDYNNLVQKITFYSLFLITASLIINIFVRFDIQGEENKFSSSAERSEAGDERSSATPFAVAWEPKDLILKTILFSSILILFILINKEFIIQLIPHNLGIY